MTLTEYFLAQLEAEAPKTRRVLEQVPTGRDDWQPHQKSMPFGRLAMLVARMPSWFPLIVDHDSLDLSGSNVPQTPLKTAAELVAAHDEAVEAARKSFRATKDDTLLNTNWKLTMGGNVMSDQPKHIVVRDTFMHLAHHRAQLTVYLRLNDATVPAIYGPSADDQRFA